jgi:hypothetical protein
MTDPAIITIVSGLPRSGTSMMMRMLEAGGIEPLIDNIRQPDADNPHGYYEFERVKQIKQDTAWLDDARGKVVKMVSRLLFDLPPTYRYKVVFMRRRMEEVLASQRQMLIRSRKPADTVSDVEMAALFEKHLRQFETWVKKQPHIDILYVDHREVLDKPGDTAATINAFLENRLDTSRMVAVVDRTLYRQRK